MTIYSNGANLQFYIDGKQFGATSTSIVGTNLNSYTLVLPDTASLIGIFVTTSSASPNVAIAGNTTSGLVTDSSWKVGVTLDSGWSMPCYRGDNNGLWSNATINPGGVTITPAYGGGASYIGLSYTPAYGTEVYFRRLLSTYSAS